MSEFFKTEKTDTIILISLSLFISLIYTNLASYVSAGLIESVQRGGSIVDTMQNFYYFIAISVIFLIIFYVYKYMQNKLLIKVLYWIKYFVYKVILKINNVNMANVSFIDFLVPINRISSSCYSIFFEVISDIIPTAAFLIAITGYFMFKDFFFGLFFILANIAVWVYFYFFWDDIYKYKQKHEDEVVSKEQYIIDILNNLDKVIYRGKIGAEVEEFEKKTDETIEFSRKMVQYITNHSFVMNLFVNVIVVGTVGYLIKLHSNKTIDTKTFIAFFTIMIMYRDSLTNTVHGIPNIVEHFGRMDNMVIKFNNMIGNQDVNKILQQTSMNSKMHNELTFEKIQFQNVSYTYQGTDSPIFKNFNADLNTSGKIIGITGMSGRGKTTFMKLLLKVHSPTKGRILIDGTNVEEIDADYLREQITFVPQNSRLFDRKIIENLYYGCNDKGKCEKNLEEILKYPKIRELYKKVNLEGPAGALGENLSGGQRQIANVISGLINPSKILVLDEPTNALDGELKRELLTILGRFGKFKTCLMIITHDRDVVPMFDETLSL